MNSLVSYKWLSEHVDLADIVPEEFARRISLSGPAVEKIHRRDAFLGSVVVGIIKEVNSHPDADKLRVCMVDIGEKELAQIVCGGSNLEVGQYVAVAKVGASVLWHGEGEPVMLEPVKLRGVESQGMICGANEIGLADAFPHEEKEILDLKKEIPELKAKAGAPLADILDLAKDVVMDIEVTSNRVDAMGIIGMAREASTILEKPFTWKPSDLPKAPKASAKELKISVLEPALCPRYMGVRIKGVKNGNSPWWIKDRLMSAGLNSISLLVDITNYILLEYAQPMHVFDVARLQSKDETPSLSVRMAQVGEKMVALDGNEYELDDRSLIIADHAGPVALAGVMGGERSGAYADTEDIILECATFDAVSIRRTARRVNLYSDSQLRFEKGLSTEAVPPAMAKAIELILELAGGEVVSVIDERKGKYKPETFSISTKEVNGRIGIEIPKKKQIAILKSLGFEVSEKKKDVLSAVVPWWRDHDIEDAVDLIEEIARVYGYVNIPAVLPVGDQTPRQENPMMLWEDKIKDIAKGAGLTECYTYSFVSEYLLERAGFSSKNALRVLNPLTEEFAIMRTSLLPSLLQVIAENQERFNEQMIFESANVYYPSAGQKEGAWTELPSEEREFASAILAGEKSFVKAKGFVEHLLEEIGIGDLYWERMEEPGFWHPGRTVQVFQGEHLIATIGEVAPHILSAFKIDQRLAMIHMPLKESLLHARAHKGYVSPNPFPESKRDLAIVVGEEIEYGTVSASILSVDPLISDVEWFDTYRGKGLPDGKKSLAMHITFASPERTLTSDAVDGIMKRILQVLKNTVDAEQR